ncbi:hypothetical protein Fot_38745 [Forsythia ovata]|uniref:Uncharacterized protein n=1 Tax=Forsythia ovata TaxID=205694 RepID=A0ABD1S2N4_9LAMI
MHLLAPPIEIQDRAVLPLFATTRSRVAQDLDVTVMNIAYTSHVLRVDQQPKLNKLVQIKENKSEEMLKVKSDLEEILKGKVEVEAIRDFVMAKKLQDADANFLANFHLTEAYTIFSNYFASVGQQEVINALRSEHPDFDLSSFEAKFPPMDIEDPPTE